jgi:hypothetical protein
VTPRPVQRVFDAGLAFLTLQPPQAAQHGIHGLFPPFLPFFLFSMASKEGAYAYAEIFSKKERMQMKHTIAAIHATRVSLAPVEETIGALYPETELIHLLDEGMSRLAKSQGRISGANLSQAVSLIRRAEELGAEGILLSAPYFPPTPTSLLLRRYSPCRRRRGDV